ncbi:MAG TPA: hypothetical protein PLP17_14480, partial [Oligoflexia bacterium]|nr:hypothetical protein [Oligoflexia bacterium]
MTPVRQKDLALCRLIVFAVCALMICGLLGGCGGGSIGTGAESSFTVSGTVETKDGAAVAGAEVSVSGMQEVVVTDANGLF